MRMRILFVCSGNTCRSPLATFLARRIVEEYGAEVAGGFSFTSAGTGAAGGQPASQHAQTVAAERAAVGRRSTAGDGTTPSPDLSSHTSAFLTADAIHQADLVLTMSTSHRRAVESLVPAAIEKTFTLKEYAEAARHAIGEGGRDGGPATGVTIAGGAAAGGRANGSLVGGGEAVHGPSASHDIADPFGGDLETYRQVAAEIETELRAVLSWLVSQREGNAGNRPSS